MRIKELFNKIDKTQKSSLMNLCLKPISMVLGLIYTPMLLNYLGDTQYGLWSTVLSIISWVNYADVGIGHGLRNLLTKELAESKLDRAKKTVSTAYMVLSCISLVLLITSIVFVIRLDWHTVFNTNIDMRAPMAVSFLFICVNFVLSLSNYILYALHLAEQVSVRNIFVQCINIVGIFGLNKFTNSSLFLVSILFGASTTVVYLLNSISIFKNNRYLCPSIMNFDRSKIGEICNVGIKFFIIQLACIALYTVDNLLITYLYGGASVTPFNITYRIFNTAYAFLTAICVPYWSKTTDAVTRKDFAWIRKNLKILRIIAGLFVLGFILLAFIFKPLTTIWLGRELDYPNGLIVVMCIYYCLYSIVTVHTQLINGTGKINFQLVLMCFMGASNIPLSIFLARECGMGVVGIRTATTILMAIAAVAFPINLNCILNDFEKNN